MATSDLTTTEQASPMSPRRRGAPPAIVLGGGANALSIVRSLGRRGIPSYAINAPQATVRYSRYCRWLNMPDGPPKEVWSDYLLGDASAHLRGSVLLAASDDGLEVLIEHQAELAEKYLLDLMEPGAQSAMLNKLATYQAAQRAGVLTPKFWISHAWSDVISVRDELVFPLLVKPLLSHLFAAKFGVKFFTANSYAELEQLYQAAGDDLDVMLVEKIPGPDTQLCSYYTYIDEQGEHLFQFTKRIVRRFPPEMGIACRHVTDHIPELAEPAAALFHEVGLRGLANVEFKQDPRDGSLKLIECNARFTAANVLLDRCGYDLAYFVYQRITQGDAKPPQGIPKPTYLWTPIDDLRSFLILRRQGELSFLQWLRSIATTNVALSNFSLFDPFPTLADTWNRMSRAMKRLVSSKEAP